MSALQDEYYYHSEIPSEEAQTSPWWGYAERAFYFAARSGMLKSIQQYFSHVASGLPMLQAR